LRTLHQPLQQRRHRRVDLCQKARALIRAAGSGFSATAKYDLASKGVLASLTQLRKLDGGRLLEASAVWSSRTQQWLLEATGRPHAAHKVSATCAPGLRRERALPPLWPARPA